MNTNRRSWKPLGPNDVEIGGDLRRRAEANLERLQYDAFLAPGIFTNVDSDDWPGDWVSRTLHANILLSRSLGRDSSQAAAIVGGLRSHMNEHGYFGPAIDPDALNEQQLGSPHGWLMRGLIEYHLWTGDPESLSLLARLLENIALPMADWWQSYPITIDERGRDEGEMVGLATWKSGKWLMSSDIGNQFMLLDGMSQAYQFAPTPELKASIDAGVTRFLEVDLMGTFVQTHATLTTLRALLRMHETTGESRYLQAATERYALYRTRGMTENYANNNWFGRPDTWTEPCAVIDSFIVALGLWRHHEDPLYLEDAHLIWFNAVARGQRGNGGFGCDTCAGFDGPLIRMRDFYEAFFCCTQRGGEGHATAIRSTYHVAGDSVSVTFFEDSVARLSLASGALTVRQHTNYPTSGSTRLEIIDTSIDAAVQWRFFAPSWVEGVTVSLNGERLDVVADRGFVVAQVAPRAGDVITLEAQVLSWSRSPINPTSVPGHLVHHWGPVVLAHLGADVVQLPDEPVVTPNGRGGFSVSDSDVTLTALGDAIEYAPSHEVIRSYEQGDYRGNSAELIAEVDGLPRQLLFAVSSR